MIKKPRRGWYAIPGGKMEHGETIKEAAIREYREETALHVKNPSLAGVFTFSIFEEENLQQEWMMFTFVCDTFTGELTDNCKEGELEWIPIDTIASLPMAEGDRKIFAHILSSDELLYGAFSYTKDFDLLAYRFDPSTD